MSHGNVSRTNVWLNDGNGNFTLSDVQLPGVSESSVEPGDFGNMGVNDLLVNGNCNGGYQGYTTDRRIAALCKNLTQTHNTAPTAPGELKAEVDESTVTLSWGSGDDAETPASALSYNFYIRDLSTGKFIKSPDSDIRTGHRSIVSLGNAYMNKSWTVRNLPKGEYAWSVQSVDAAYSGSRFAPEQTFTIIDDSGVEDVVCSGAKDNAPMGYYNLQGIRFDEPQQGLNIVKYSDGSVEKIVF